MTVATYIQDVIYGRRRSPWLLALLTLVSFPFRTIINIRNALYSHGILRQKKLPQQVISVGNITLGGTGKTPTVILVTEQLLRRGYRPAVLSRGYGRRHASQMVVVSDGRQVLADAALGGDEPALIAASVAKAPVVVSRDRHQAGMLALRRFGTDTIILDDGFQHRRLKRDRDIVLIDAEDPFGNGKIFPAGILREPLSSLERAHAILITRSDGIADLAPLKTLLRRHTGAPVFTSIHEPVAVIDIMTGSLQPLSSLRRMRVLAFSGIARNDSFLSLLRVLGAEVTAEIGYQDHYQYVSADLATIRKKAADLNASMIITTEKDAVRLKPLQPEGIVSLRISLKIIEEQEWERVLFQGL